jgi:hypothetical protein
MNKKHLSLLIFGLIESVLLAISTFIIPKNSSISFSILTALFFIVSPIVYYLLSRKTQTEFTFWSVFYLTFKATPYLFPMKENFFKIIFDWKIYFNIAFLLFLSATALHFIVNFKKNAQEQDIEDQDEFTLISNALQKSIKFKRLGKMIAFEICSFYYCFFKWSHSNTTLNQYTGFKNSGVSALYIGLMFVSIVEAVAIHILLISWNKNLAIVFLVLHLYLLVNLIGHLKAIIFRRHLIVPQKIIIRYGLFNSLEIPLHKIEKISKFEGDYQKSKNLVKFALLGNLEPHNLAIEFKDSTTINLPFGIVKKSKSILLYVDNVNEFITKVVLCLDMKS